MKSQTQQIPKTPQVPQMAEIPVAQEPKPIKKPIIIIALALIILILGGVVLTKGNKTNNVSEEESAFEGLPEADKNIVVDLKPVEKGKVYMLIVSKIPKEITSVEYEMKYKTEGQDGKEKTEGIFGTSAVSNSSFTKELVLGTESSGVRRYHKLTDGKATLTIKFIEPKGPSRLQKQFNLL